MLALPSLRRTSATGALAALGAASALALAPAPAPAHGPVAHLSAAEERGLRAFERKTLGPAHAAEHARSRAMRRSPAARAQMRRVERRLRAALRREAARARQSAPTTDGEWTEHFEIPVFGIHTTLLPTGKVLFFSYGIPRRLEDDNNTAQAWLFDPTKAEGQAGRFERVDPPLWTDPKTGKTQPANIWCAGQSLLGDGQVLVTGGNLEYEQRDAQGNLTKTFRGLNKVYTFDPFTETWAEQPDMADGRWYPTQTLLPDGRTLIMSGDDSTSDDNNRDIEVFTPAAQRGGRGTITKLGEARVDYPDDGGLYPHVFTMPSGRALVGGPYAVDSWFFKPSGGYDEAPGQTEATRYAGTGVLLPSAPGTPGVSSRVMQLGGGGEDGVSTPHKTSEVFDEAQPGAGWQPGPALESGRSHHNTVLLPGGEMVTVGGGLGRRANGDQWATDLWEGETDDHRKVELYDPETKQWRHGDAQLEPRAYHSTALLLPDGRVLSAGDDINGLDGKGQTADTAEIFEPPYLHRGARPVLRSAPASVAWGERFRVETPSAVTRAVLMAPGAVTHSNDMSQRHVELAVRGRDGAGLELQAPASGAIAPPGYYMLFLLDGKGVPSVSKWVRVGAPAAVSETPAPPADGGPQAPPADSGAGTPGPVAPTPTPVAPRPAPKPAPQPAPLAPLALSAQGSALARTARTVRVRVKVGAAARVRIGAAVGRVRIAPSTVVLRRAGTRVVSVRLSTSARALLRSGRARAVALVVTARDASGRSATKRTTVRVRR